MQTNTHIGRLLKQVNLTHIGEKQTPKATFGLAVGNRRNTDFIYYTAYNKVAENLMQYANQTGVLLEVQFDMRSRQYTAKDNHTKYFVENVVCRLKVHTSPTKQDKLKPETPEVSRSETPQRNNFEGEPDDLNDLATLFDEGVELP